MVKVNCVVEAGNILGEAPIWHPEEQALYWVDAFAPAIQRLDKDGKVDSWEMPELTASLVFREQGGIVAAMKSGFKLVDLDKGEVVHLVDPEPDQPRNWLNDGKCDRRGRYWCGSVDHQLASPSGSLYRLDPDHTAHKMDTGFIVSNGMAWSPDNKTMYFADSRANTVYAYDFDIEHGVISNRRQFISTADIAARVDGATVDTEGNYWCAHIADWHVACYGANGDLLRRIELPVEFPTMCSFGGTNLDILYVTTSSQGLDDEQKRQQPLAGGLFSIEGLGVQGLTEPFYAG